MSKLKTRKSIAKRFKITKTGKVLRRGGASRHLLRNKTKKRIRHQRAIKNVEGKIAKKIKKALGVS